MNPRIIEKNSSKRWPRAIHNLCPAAAVSFVMLGIAATLVSGQGKSAEKTYVRLIGIIPIPGNPLASADIAWVDPGTKRFYLADRSNLGIDIIDAENNLFVGRVTGFAGPGNATPPPPNGQGPNGVLVTPNKKVWAGDGNSTVQVADVDPSSPSYL